MLRNNRGQIFTLIELLVVAAIILGASYFMLDGYVGGGTKSKGSVHAATPIERGHAVDCMNNLRQIRYAITMYQQDGDKYPPSLDELAERYRFPSSMLECDVSGKPYTYDATQGKVSCTTPGHENY